MVQFNLYLLIVVLLYVSDGNSTETSSFESLITDQNAQINHLISQLNEQNTKLSTESDKLCDLETEATTLKTELTTIKDTITELQQCCDSHGGMVTRLIRSTGGSSNDSSSGQVFTRWGRKDCPAGVSELVYSGVAGGSYYGHGGGAAEYICLPPDPTFNNNKHFPGSYFGYVYGAEYEHMPVKSLLDHDVPCAVCRTTGYTTVLMIPGRGECYDGWTEAYHGELGSGYYGHAIASQYICLDQDYESTGRTDNKLNKNGKLIYPTRAKCGSLPCPPYEDNTLLTCSVCLK